MAIIMDFQEKKYHKQMDFERQALRELSFEKIEASIHDGFDSYLSLIPSSGSTGMDMSAEYALEAFLLGSSMGKFGFYGEEKETVYKRSEKTLELLQHDFYEFWRFWLGDDPALKDLEVTCRTFLNQWWGEGYESSLKRWRLKLQKK